jgi:hypothetical protein
MMVASAVMLAACGADPFASASAESAAPSTRGMVAFGDAGSTRQMQFRDNAAGAWRRSENCGFSSCVTVDRVPGVAGSGQVSRVGRGGTSIYRVFGAPRGAARMPDGIYNGPLTASYRVGANGAWVTREGEMNMVLDTRRGTVAIGGILPYDHRDGPNSIQFFGDAKIERGRFAARNVDIIVGSGTQDAFRTKGRVNGMLASGKRGSAIFGTVGSARARSGLALKGGFTAAHDPRHSLR